MSMLAIQIDNLEAKMTCMFQHFGVDKELYKILAATGAYISGGTCSAIFKNKPLDSSQDLDIWIPMPTTLIPLPADQASKYKVKYVKKDYYMHESKNIFKYNAVAALLFSNYFEELGFKEEKLGKGGQSSRNAYYQNLGNNIHSIINYTKLFSPKKIQLIFTWDVRPEDNVANFDLTCCKFFYTTSLAGEASSMFFVGSLEELELLKKGMAIYTRTTNPTNKAWRIAKYKGRGWTILIPA